MQLQRAGILAICAFALAPNAASAEPHGPMQDLARDLGTPNLGYRTHNAARTESMFEFVRSGETVEHWTKLTTIVATRVEPNRTAQETRATIVRIRGLLSKNHAEIRAYDVRDQAPPVAYFNYVMGGETDVGVIFSPQPGIVTIQQVAAHRAGAITAKDIRHIEGLIGYPG